MSYLQTNQSNDSDLLERIERKRVLNVLAQRRYRQRQRQKLQLLKDIDDALQQPPCDVVTSSSDCSYTSPNSTSTQYTGNGDSSSTSSLHADSPLFYSLEPQSTNLNSAQYAGNGAPSSPSSVHMDSTYFDFFDLPTAQSPSTVLQQAGIGDSNPSITEYIDNPDLNFFELQSSLPSAPDMITNELFSIPQPQHSQPSSLDPSDSTDSPIYDSSSSSTTPPQTTNTTHPSLDIPTSLQLSASSHTTFPDARLRVPLLSLLTAATTLATHLHSLDRLFDLSALSIFNDPSSTTSSTLSAPEWTLSLPPNLRPTPAQLTIPHHPLLDMLPWPDVRTKLICVFSMPEAAAPRDRLDGTKLDFERFVADVDDGALEVCGEEPTRTDAWEIVDETFLDRWWWAFGGGVLREMNGRRRARGESVLKWGGTL